MVLCRIDRVGISAGSGFVFSVVAVSFLTSRFELVNGFGELFFVIRQRTFSCT